jgi:hypothetical protein
MHSDVFISSNQSYFCSSFSQYDHLAFYYKFILVVIYVIMLIVETVRLYLGNTGNLHEKVNVHLVITILVLLYIQDVKAPSH